MHEKLKRRCPAWPTSTLAAVSFRPSHCTHVTRSTPRSTHTDPPLLPSPSACHTTPTEPTLSTIADTTQPTTPGLPLASLLASKWSLADFLAYSHFSQFPPPLEYTPGHPIYLSHDLHTLKCHTPAFRYIYPCTCKTKHVLNTQP